MKPAASQITRKSKSNLALAFISLGKERRRDMTVFYAFCRVIDDISDAEDLPSDTKQRRLDQWRAWIRSAGAGEPELAQEVRDLLSKYRLAPAMLDEIIAGVEMDLTKSRYATFEDLRLYCYRVASAVGLVAIEIFGYKNPGMPRVCHRTRPCPSDNEHHTGCGQGFVASDGFICHRTRWRGFSIPNRT